MDRPNGRLVRETFGDLWEALLAQLTAQTLPSMQRRWQRRRDLAELITYPEGYEFETRLNDGSVRSVILLSPPNIVAVRRVDGSWFRRDREFADGPQPYNIEWYIQYLEQHRLPTWFMGDEHRRMVEDDRESERLGLENRPTIVCPPPRHYTEVRYPTRPDYAEPGEHPYSHVLSNAEIRRIARQFPAVLANAAMNNRRVIILPSGHHIVIRQNVNDGLVDQTPEKKKVTWKKASQDDLMRLSSFVTEGDDATFQSQIEIPTTDRSLEREAAEATGGIVDIDQIPAGAHDGRWEWLNEDVDQPLATALHLDGPMEVVSARENGRLRGGILRNAIPRVVYFPDRRYFNPPSQPTPLGFWHYLTTGEGSSEQLAHLNFGGQGPYFADTPRPTAAEIQNLRELNQAAIRDGNLTEDSTDEIDIVWVPTDDDLSDHASKNVNDQDVTNDHNLDPSVRNGPEKRPDNNDIDPDSGLVHEPLNRGENNQTSERGTKMYQTIMIDGKKYTVDRSPANAGHREPHKTWMPNGSGDWRQYKHAGTLDWDNEDMMSALNKWRDQEGPRAGFPHKRKEKRKDYTEEQKQWLFDNYVVPAKGNKPLTPGAEITRAFNRKFDDDRKLPGIGSLLARLQKEYKKNNGKMKKHPGRTKRKSRHKDVDDEDAPAAKKRKTNGAGDSDGDEEHEDERDEGDDGHA